MGRFKLVFLYIIRNKIKNSYLLLAGINFEKISIHTQTANPSFIPSSCGGKSKIVTAIASRGRNKGKRALAIYMYPCIDKNSNIIFFRYYDVLLWRFFFVIWLLLMSFLNQSLSLVSQILIKNDDITAYIILKTLMRPGRGGGVISTIYYMTRSPITSNNSSWIRCPVCTT